MTSPVSGAGSGDQTRKPIAVFLLDDHEIVRRGVRDLLEAEPDIANRQIGERMFLAEKTVKNYVSALFAKLGMERRTQAAAYAVRVLGDQHDGHEGHAGPGD